MFTLDAFNSIVHGWVKISLVDTLHPNFSPLLWKTLCNVEDCKQMYCYS